MRRSPLFLVVLACCAPKQELTETMFLEEGISIVERIRANNEYFDGISLTALETLENGSFNGLLVWKDDSVVFADYNADGFDTLNFSAFNGVENQVGSELIFYHETMHAGYIFLKGADHGCCVPTMTVVKVDETGFRKLFDEGFQIEKVLPVRNGDIRFYGTMSNAEPVNLDASSDTLISAYNPTVVLNLANDLRMDSSVTKTYNESVYVFAGYSYRGDIRVAYSTQDKFKPYILETEKTAQEDCVFDNNYRKLTTDWLKQSGVESFIWDDKNNRAIITHDGDTIFASQGGCEHFGILIERQYAFDIHPLEDFDHWLGEAHMLAEQFGLEFYAREIRSGKIQGIKETNGSLWYEVGDDDPADNLYYNGIEIRPGGESKTVSLSQYYN